MPANALLAITTVLHVRPHLAQTVIFQGLPSNACLSLNFSKLQMFPFIETLLVFKFCFCFLFLLKSPKDLGVTLRGTEQVA